MNNDFYEYLRISKQDFDSRFNKNNKSIYKLNDFKPEKVLGTGGFGKVYLVHHEPSNDYFAMKSIEKRKIVRYKYLKQCLNEKRILEAIRFPFVVHMEHFFKDDTHIHFVMPFINGGDLFNQLSKCGKFDEDRSKFYASQVILALEYLHNCNLIYRDLKPENIMIDYKGYIKLTDFGFCKHITKHYTWTTCGTPYYMAPELIKMMGYGFSVDWWCFGILTYEMNAGRLPFVAENIESLHEKINSGIFECPSSFSDSLKDLLKNSIVVDKTKRIACMNNGIKQLKNHEWFRSIDWNAILEYKIKPSFVPILSGKHDTKYFTALDENISKIESSNEQYESIFKDF